MKSMFTLILACALFINVTAAELNRADLEKKFEIALGPEWIVAKDFESFIAVRRNVKLLNRVSRVDPILGGEDPWEGVAPSDYLISIQFRPRMSDSEFVEMSKLRSEWIAKRTRGLKPSTKAFDSERRLAEAILILPDFHLEDFDIYVRSTNQGFFRVRPESVIESYDRIIEILTEHCSTYKSQSE